MSSFNDEDYEVGENSDDEEQEDPGDYVKGTLCGVACKRSCFCSYGVCLKSSHNNSDICEIKFFTN